MKFDMSLAWREAVAMISANREVLATLAGFFFFLPSVLLGLSVPEMESLFANPEGMNEAMMSLYAQYGWIFVLVTIAQIIGYLSLLALLRDHGRPTVREAIRTGLKGLLPAIGTYILVVLCLSIAIGILITLAAVTGNAAIAALVGLIAVAGLVYAAVKVLLAAPVIALDKVFNPIEVLRRSWQLTRGNTFLLLLFFLMIFAVYMVVMLVVGLLVAGIALAVGETAGRILNALASGVLGAVASVIFVAVLAAIHRQLSGPSAAAIGETFE